MRGNNGTEGNGQQPGYLCASYGRWGRRSPTCGHYRVDHDVLEFVVLDYLTQTAPQVKALLDATTAIDMEAARPLLDAIRATEDGRNSVWFDMFSVVSDHEATTDEKFEGDTPTIYGHLYERARPSLETRIAEKEAELEDLLDGYKDLSPKLRERANRRGEALQEEIDDLNRQLCDLRIPWEHFREDLAARQDALERATAVLNQEGHCRQKAEVLKTVVDKIVCHFRRVGKRATLERVEVIPAEGAAVRPLSFCSPLLTDSRLRAFARGFLPED